MRERRIEVVQRLGNTQIGVGVEIAGKFISLVTQIRLDFEFGVEAVIHLSRFERAPEFAGHFVVGQIGDVPHHARHPQAAARLHRMRVVVAAVKIRIGQDRLPRHFVERDVLRRQVGRAGDHQRVTYALRIGDAPLHALHGAEAAAHHCGKLRNPQLVGQARLRVDPVFDRHQGEIRAPRAAAGGIERQRAGRAVTAAQIVDADHEEPVGVQRLSGSDHVVPPADVGRVVGVYAGNMVGSIERMAHQHRVRACGVQRAVGLKGQFIAGERAPALQQQRLVKHRTLRRYDT